MRNAIAVGCLTTALTVGFSVSASALTFIIDSRTGPAIPNVAVQWISTSDPVLGNQWLAGINATGAGIAQAYAPYPNGLTNPETLVPGTTAELMWHCGQTGAECEDSNGVVTGMDGPVETFYKFVFPAGRPLAPGAHEVFKISASILADDYFDLYGNGVFIASGLLDDSINFMGGLPFEIAAEVPLLPGNDQILAIRALDGYLVSTLAGGIDDCLQTLQGTVTTTTRGDFCAVDRLNEYVFIDGIVNIAEPPSLAVLTVGGLLAFAVASGLVPARTRRG